ASGIGLLIGPPLGGLLYSWGGFDTPFLVAAALVALDGVGRLLLLPAHNELPVESPASARTMGRLLREPPVVIGLVATSVGAVVFSSLDPNLPSLLAERFGLGPLLIGMFFGGLVLLFTVTQPIAAVLTEKAGAPLIMGLGLIICALCLIEVALASTLLHVSIILGLLALGTTLALAPAPELLTRSGRAPSQSGASPVGFGTLYATYNVAYAGGLLAGPALSGAVISALGPAIGFSAMGALVLPLGILVTRLRTERQRTGTGAVAAAAPAALPSASLTGQAVDKLADSYLHGRADESDALRTGAPPAPLAPALLLGPAVPPNDVEQEALDGSPGRNDVRLLRSEGINLSFPYVAATALPGPIAAEHEAPAAVVERV